MRSGLCEENITSCAWRDWVKPFGVGFILAEIRKSYFQGTWLQQGRTTKRKWKILMDHQYMYFYISIKKVEIWKTDWQRGWHIMLPVVRHVNTVCMTYVFFLKFVSFFVFRIFFRPRTIFWEILVYSIAITRSCYYKFKLCDWKNLKPVLQDDFIAWLSSLQLGFLILSLRVVTSALKYSVSRISLVRFLISFEYMLTG